MFIVCAYLYQECQTGPPASAKIDYYPRLEEFLRYRAHFKVTTWLGMFGATTPKAVKLFSDDGFVQHLVRTAQWWAGVYAKKNSVWNINMWKFCKGVLLPTMSCDQHWVITAKGLPHDSGVMTSHTSKTMGNHVSVFVFGLPWTFLLEFDQCQNLISSSIGSTVI